MEGDFMNTEQRVLIIHSDFENCKQIKYMLQEYGVDAYYTQSVVEGIDHFMRYGYQPVILDISLSEESGLHLH